MRIPVPLAVALLAIGCSGAPSSSLAPDASAGPREDTQPDGGSRVGALPRPEAIPGTWLRMDISATGADIYAAPWPAEHLREGDVVRLTGFPRPGDDGLVDRMAAVIEGGLDGLPTTAPIHFAATAPLDDALLPTLEGTLAPGALAFLVCVDPDSADHGRRVPVSVSYQADGGPHGAPDLLTLTPLQGIPLRPGVRYAAVVRRALLGAAGGQLGVPLDLAEALAGVRPEGLSEAAWAEIDAGIDQLVGLGLSTEEIAAVAVFRTGHPQRDMTRFFDHAAAATPPAAPVFEARETFDDFCVFEGTIEMPTYQAGVPPYLDTGGGWGTTAAGEPLVHGTETARVVVTVPRRPPPASGYPTAVFIRTGGGGDRPLVDRGVRPEAGADPLVPGSGPAREFARVGWAGISVDGPHGGLRNVMGGDEQLLIFNIDNPEALRDNIRQSALEIALIPELVGAWSVDATGCPGVGAAATFDRDMLALMGHSMGATIAPLAMAVQPAYRGLVLSGAGGSWIENVLYKQSPIEVRPVAELILGYHLIGRSLAPGDPTLTLLQWAGEAADPPNYGRAFTGKPADGIAGASILMLQGIVDTYIPPPVANATSLSLGLDLAGPSLDAEHPALVGVHRPLEDLLPFVGGTHLELPAGANADDRTALVTQHAEDGIEDGHEVVFQTEAPKEAYRCFLADLADAVAPTVPLPGSGACD